MAFFGGLLLSLIVFILGMFSYQLAEYFLARDQLLAVVQAAALSCQTALASSGNTTDSGNQTNAYSTGLYIFQGNSILGNSLSTATLCPTPTPPFLAAGQATLSFQLLDAWSHQPIVNPQPGVTTSAIIQATGTYGYLPTFAQFLGFSLIPMQLQTSALSGVSPLDLVVILDVSGGMDDETDVTLVERYWDYDNNFPPHHIVYMIPPMDGDPTQPAQGPIGGIFCYQAPNVNGLPPQSLQLASTDPTLPPCKQSFTNNPGSPALPLRSAGLTDSQNPPGNYVAAHVGATAPPGMMGPVSLLQIDLQQIALNTMKISQGINSPPTGPGNFQMLASDIPGLLASPNALSQLEGYIDRALILDGATVGQVIEAINAGHAAAGPMRPYTLTGFNAWPFPQPGIAIFTNSTGYMPPMTRQGPGPSSPGYWRYGLFFASGSAASDPNAVIVPTGTPGPSTGAPLFQPIPIWGPITQQTFTDLVVNLDGKVQFAGCTYNGFSFPSVGALVEAQRGNLDSAAAALAAGVDLQALGVTPKAGYQAAYQQAALLEIEPLMAVERALNSFLTEAVQMGSTYLGFISFNDNAGTTPGQTFTDANIAPIYPPGGNGVFPLPGISLAANNAAPITSVLSTLRVGNGRNTAKALQAALNQFTSSGRPGSIKAIVLITDGVPDTEIGGIYNPVKALSDTRAQAVNAHAQGVAIFTVAITDTFDSQAQETAIYNDTNDDALTGGISAIAKHGGRYYQIQYTNASTTQTNLMQTFANILRQLVSLTL